MSRIAEGIENLGVTMQEITGQLDRVEERIDVVEMAVRPAPTR